MKSPNVWVNWLQLVTSVGSLTGPAGGQADEGGDRGADALDGPGAGLDLLDVDAGRQVLRHAGPSSLNGGPATLARPRAHGNGRADVPWGRSCCLNGRRDGPGGRLGRVFVEFQGAANYAKG